MDGWSHMGIDIIIEQKKFLTSNVSVFSYRIKMEYK